jgi:dienelactone hydrolase
MDDPVWTETLAGSDRPAHYFLAETLDGLYTPYALRLPEGDGPHPFVFIAYGNGGGGLAWLHDRVHRFRHITDVLLDAGYACAWSRYRTEVELGYQTGGALRTDIRQGMELMSRAPLEYEDEVAVLRHVARHPRIDADRLFHLGVSHAGEMLFKLLSQYRGLLRAGVAAEPASHELLTLRLDDAPTVKVTDGLRNIEHLEVRSVERARARITDPDEVSRRLDGVDIPVLVLGREQDELQGIFRLTYELLAEKRADAEWRSWSHDVHGYIYPETGADGVVQVDDVQKEALAVIVDFLNRQLKS